MVNKQKIAANKALVKKKAKQVAKRKSVSKSISSRMADFGAVATVNTAPVAIGNSVRGAATGTVATPNGVIAYGRDFMFTPIGTGTIQTWTMVGGTPISPVAFADSTVRQYLQMYQKYRWKRLTAHYITSSPTSATGDVMFYHGKNRDSVFLNQTSSFLLPFVISDPDTVIGPQWTNHSAQLHLEGSWKSTDYGMGPQINDYADGELFLLSKTASTDSPGYILFDYIIEFSELQISPRLLSLPLPRAQYKQLNLGATTAAVVDATTTMRIGVVGNGIDASASAWPTGATAGDVYKVIIDLTNSGSGAWTNVTTATLFTELIGGGSSQTDLVPSDGMTLYGVYDANQLMTLYPTVAAAMAAGNITGSIRYGVTATVTWSLQCWISLVGSLNTLNLIPNY